MRGRFILAALAALSAVLLAGLGVWQIERRAWKLDLIATTQARLSAAPVALPAREAWPDLARDGGYMRVQIAGEWQPTPPVFVKAVTALGSGWWVMNALETGQGSVIVNRGFVPAAERGSVATPSGSAVVAGLLRPDEPGGAFLRSNDPAADRWFSRDVSAMARARGWEAPAPFFIDAAARAEAAWPRGGMTVVRFRNHHLIYALTWFALAGLAGWFAWRVARG